ncbi:serine/threonine protein kinase [Streptomyces pactum]|uniref:non-specific serine/threonine protein kinase n=1 Tax=Streptomyces pactum TaxID=68249 RepID=A0ABS0NRW5_9ACTN|nr:serine/threonine-protein kinase [Streptomyces pactum]MBH5337946.1 serine/threonine protein kinase [Streptomyces pactum]
MPERGAVLGGRYRLLRRIGLGGMGVVHEALDTALDRRVAVKILPTPQDPDDGGPQLARFRRETQALARIRHPNVVAVHDSGSDPAGHPYLVMELLDGVELQRLVDRYGALEPDVVRWIASGMSAALAAAHAAGVLHRDVKPSNVRITRSGRVVLQDFGLARLVEETAITRVGFLVGTPRYMAPEVIRGEPPSPRSDLYGLGLCMYLMLTGESPRGAQEDVGALVERAIDDEVPQLYGNQLAGHMRVPDRLAYLVDVLCAADPQTRPETAADLQTTLAASTGTAARAAELVQGCLREDALHLLAEPGPALPGAGDQPEYLEPAVTGPAAAITSPLSLSDATREVVMGSMTVENATSRLREAVGLVQRGELQEAVRVLTAVSRVCAAALGDAHPTTLASRYWHGVCLARLGAGGPALALFAQVNSYLDTRRYGEDG